jgi:hypothetical protein
MTHRTMTPFLRNALRADAVLSGATALALMADADPLAAWTGLPPGLMRAIGVALIPWVGLLAWLASRRAVSAVAVAGVIGLNLIWALDCVLAAFGLLGAAPGGFGVGVLAVQAVGTVVLAELEWLGLRRAGPVSSTASVTALAR